MADPAGRDLQARGAGSHVDLADKLEQPAGVLPDTFLEKSMEIRCGFSNIQDMARAVRESAELIEGRHFSPRPWNRFEPENTDWWIVPSSDWPAYRYGKGMFTFSGRFPDRILCCLNVEKGFGRIAAEAYPEIVSRGYVLDDGWSWFALLEGLADGTVARAAGEISETTGHNIVMEISCWYTSSPSDFEPYPLLDEEALRAECRSSLDAGRVWFSVEKEALEKLEERCLTDVTRPIASCGTLADLPEALRGDSQLAWVWIDVYLGVLVSLAKGCDELGECLDSAGIWRTFLRPWGSWIR